MLDSIFQASDKFLAFLGRELAPSRRRVIEAARNAVKSTVTTGLATIFQTVGPFGPLFAFRIGQPGISFGWFEGALTIACAAVMQAAIVPITGELLDYPGLIMAFVFVLFTAVGYLLSAKPQLFLILALVVIGTITTVYMGIFEPGKIGWGSTYTFDGILLATLVMVAIDTSIWPSPLEPRLFESLAKDFERTRGRLALVGQRYFAPGAASLPPPQVISTLGPNLALLASIKEHAKPAPQRLAILINSVLGVERIHFEVEHLATLADEPTVIEIRQRHHEKIQAALSALDEALAKRAAGFLAGLPDSSAETISALPGTIRHLNDLKAQIPLAIDELAGSEPMNLLGFLGGLETIASLLEPREQRLDSPTGEAATEDDYEPRPFIDSAALMFSIKLGAAITLGLLVGLTTQRADLQTILWSIAVVGQPNQYGAVVRKTLLRLTGCVIGGLAALAAMIIVSENFDSLPAYLVVIFVVTMFATYVAQSDEWLGYAGIQTGITFMICYVGLSPTTDVYKPLWRFWGIVLGILTAGFVFLLVWPENASDKLIERLSKLVQTTLRFAKEVTDARIADGRIAATEQRVSKELLEFLNMADQARFEGSRGVARSAAGLEAASTIIRIAYRLELIARGRLSGAEVLLPDNVSQSMAAIEETICATLNSASSKLRPPLPSSKLELPSDAPLESAIELKALIDDLVAAATLESGGWSAGLQSSFAMQLQSYYRLAILLSNLDVQFSKLAAS